jgi:hypothetical protein
MWVELELKAARGECLIEAGRARDLAGSIDEEIVQIKSQSAKAIFENKVDKEGGKFVREDVGV